MAYFEVLLRSASDPNNVQTRNVELLSKDAVRSHFSRDEKWTISHIRPLTERPDSFEKPRLKIIDGTRLIRMCRSMASMLNAKISMEDTLKFYADGLDDAELRDVLKGIRDRIASGDPAPDAFVASGRFSELFLGLVKAGSQSGSLGVAFKSIADRTEKMKTFAGRLNKAFITPILVTTLLLTVFTFSATHMIPSVEQMIKEAHQTPDAFSAFVFGVARVQGQIWPLIYVALFGVIGTLKLSAKTREKLIAMISSRWKAARKMVMGLRQLMIVGTMHLLVGNKVPVKEALSCAAKVVGGTPLQPELEKVREAYEKGAALADSFSRYTSCDARLSHMVGVGEKTATLDLQLSLLTTMFEDEADEAMAIFVAIINTLTMIFAACMIAFVYLGTMLPIVLMGPKMMQAH